MNLIAKATKFATEKHGGQFRKFSDTPYIEHPKEVAFILLSVLDNADSEMLAAALLHDVPEDCYKNVEEGVDAIRREFGGRVGGLVDEVTNREEELKKIGKRRYLLNKMNAMSDDGLTLKLSDRLHNIETLFNKNMDKDFTRWYCKQTRFILDNLRRKLTKEHRMLIGNIEALIEGAY